MDAARKEESEHREISNENNIEMKERITSHEMATRKSRMPRGQRLKEFKPRVLMWLKIALSATMFLMTCCNGMGATLYGPTLPDLQIRYKSTVEDLSKCFGLRNPGLLVGSFFSGMVNDRILDQANLIMAIGILVSSFATLLVPWCGSIWLLSIICFTQGIGQGLEPPCVMATLTSLWGKRSALPIHIVTNGWQVGITLVPLLCRNFISDTTPNVQECNQNNSHFCLPQDMNISFSSDSSNLVETSGCGKNNSECKKERALPNSTFTINAELAPIEVPYIIVTLFGLACATSFLALYCCIPREAYTVSKKSKTSWKEVFNPGSCADGKAVYGAVLVILFALYSFSANGASRIMNFVYSYLIDSGLNFSRDEAVLLLFCTTLAAVCSRTLTSIILLWCPIQIATFVEVLGSLITSICILVVGIHNKTLLWIFCIASWSFHSPMYPGKFVWLDRYIILYSFIGSISAMSNGVSGYFFEWFNGYLYTNVSPVGIFYNRVGCFASASVIFIMMQILASYHGERVRKNKNQTDQAKECKPGPV